MQRLSATPLVAGASTGARPFDAKRCWYWALRAVIEDQTFWAEELKDPAVLVLARANRMSDQLDCDAEVRGSGGTARGTFGGGAAAARYTSGRHNANTTSKLTACSQQADRTTWSVRAIRSGELCLPT